MEISGRRGWLTRNSLRGGGMDLSWNYTLGKFNAGGNPVME